MLLYSLLGIVDSIISPIISLVNTALSILSFAGGGYDGGSGVTGIFGTLIILGIIAGYILFFLGINKFQPLQQSPIDISAVGKIKLAAIFIIVGSLLSFIPVAGGFIESILTLTGFVINMIAFYTLKNSTTFPDKGRAGASKIFTALILQIIAVCLGWIPIINIISAILSIIAFIMILSGWATIKNSKPKVPDAITM